MIQIPIGYLKAAALAAGVNDIRHYLNAVRIEVQEKSVIAVGTDGHRLHAVRFQRECGLPNTAVTVPTDAIKAIKAAQRDMASLATIAVCSEGKSGRIEFGGVTITFTPVDGFYPDWRRVVRANLVEHVGVGVVQLNSDYVADAKKALGLMVGTKNAYVHLLHDMIEGAVRVAGESPDFTGVIMGMHRGPKDFAVTAATWAA